MRDKKEILKIDLKGNTVTAELWMATFKDHDHVIAYFPSLNLTGYGNSQEEAKSMLLGIVVGDYFENLFKMSESVIFDELKKLGWQRNSIFKKQFSNEAYVDKEGILKNFNLSEETEIQQHFVAV